MSYFVKIIDENDEILEVEVSEEVYQVFEDERKAIERHRKERSRHYTDEPFDEETMVDTYAQTTADSVVLQSEVDRAKTIIESCTEIQQKRFYMNRILGYSLTDIAKLEDCAVRTIKQSVDAVTKKLEKIKNIF